VGDVTLKVKGWENSYHRRLIVTGDAEGIIEETIEWVSPQTGHLNRQRTNHRTRVITHVDTDLACKLMAAEHTHDWVTVTRSSMDPSTPFELQVCNCGLERWRWNEFFEWRTDVGY
jgi:hypothetical protein